MGGYAAGNRLPDEPDMLLDLSLVGWSHRRPVHFEARGGAVHYTRPPSYLTDGPVHDATCPMASLGTSKEPG